MRIGLVVVQSCVERSDQARRPCRLLPEGRCIGVSDDAVQRRIAARQILDTPVVWQIEETPAGIVERSGGQPPAIAFEKAPAGVKWLTAEISLQPFGPGQHRRGDGGESRAQRTCCGGNPQQGAA
jgi:hypothetical protein